jgi:hypothetical protein
MNGNNPSAPPGNFIYPHIEIKPSVPSDNFIYPHIGEYQPTQLDKNVNNLEREILSILGQYKFNSNNDTDYKEMMNKISELTKNFKHLYYIEQKNDVELPEINHHYSNDHNDENFEKFEQHFKMCQYYFSKGKKELFERIQIIKGRKNELKDMRRIPANITRKVFEEIKSYEKLLDKTKDAFEYKYGRYSQFKKKFNKEIKEEKKLIGSYKRFMNKYM